MGIHPSQLESAHALNFSSNFGSAAERRVEYNPAGPTYSRSLTQFSMTDMAYQLRSGATVITATLKLYMGTDAPITSDEILHSYFSSSSVRITP